ncbi:hypothetical protein F2S75_30550 [Pseudomonas syringae pv. actinidiae]|nr:hypothetical protein [Pseudomonas syringae pv. actinidiae]
MPTSTPLPSPHVAADSATRPLRGSVKGVLAAAGPGDACHVALAILEQFHQTLERQRQRSLEYSIQLSDRMS